MCKSQHQQPFDQLDKLAAEFLREENFKYAALCYEKQIEENPYNARAYYNLAIVLHDLSRFDESFACYEKAKDLGYYASNRVNLNMGMHYLQLGNFKKGFHYVDLESDGAWRLGKNYAFNQERLKDIDFWSGQSLKGKSLLIYGEQGYGDNIQFSRYVPEVANKATKAGGKVYFSCYGVLYNIFSENPVFKNVHVLKDSPENVSDFNYKIPLLSLPRVLDAKIDEIPHSAGYIPKRAKKDWELPDAGCNVAVVWESSGLDTRRSIPFDLILPLCSIPNINMISIQKGPGILDYRKNSDVKNILPSYGEKIRDFSDTADILSQVDLLISTDTAPIHMGGALGIPTWGLLHFSADWRWFTREEYPDTSPWYESVKLYRQKEPTNWSDVIEEVKKDLKKMSSL